MLHLIFFVTAFVAVISDDLVELSYYFDENYLDVFSERLCVNTTQWSLVSYEYLELVPPYKGRSKSVKALRNSCISSFPIVFLEGTLEATVYLRTISKYSGITISVFDERDKPITSVRYQRSNKNFVTGWVDVTVPIKEHTTGYVKISGQSLNSELVIIDSLRYIPGNSSYFQNNKNDQQVISDRTSTPDSNVVQETSDPDELIFTFSENENGDKDDIEGSGEDENENGDIDDIEGSGEGETDPSVTDEPGNQTEDPGGTEDPPEPGPEGESENPGDNGFWNAFTITFVSVGAFTAVGLVGVGAYHLGKIRAVSQNPPIDLEIPEAPSIIPRARSVFSDVTYDRFSS